MYQSSDRGGRSPVTIIGAGVAGAWQALLFANAGHAVTLHERSDAGMTLSTSHWAGGMLAPWCEAEVSEPVISRLGIRSLDLWREHFPNTSFNGSLVVAHPRDRSDFERFAKMTSGHRRLDAQGVSEIEPSLEGRFREGLFYPDEGHVEPRRVLPELHARIATAGGRIEFNSDVAAGDLQGRADALEGIVIACRGLAGRDTQTELRGVKGEMIIVETDEVELSRPVRLIHPRWPLYVIPRGDGRFMLGATSIEAEDSGVSVRSALELLGAAYAVHPAFAEARIVEFGSGLRPAFPDNLPRIAIDQQKISVNGLYRHGFLLAPALAELTLGYVERGVIDNEVMQCA
jgi:glycine oxidase